MMTSKVFSLEEARELMPILRKLIHDANAELEERLESVREANECYEKYESELDEQNNSSDIAEIRSLREKFQNSLENLSRAQSQYTETLSKWVEQITSHGVILRDIREGLFDFPAQKDEFEYLLCWRIDEKDINFWHLDNDGFIGRKPLVVLQEYF